MLTFATESFHDVRDEIAPLWARHYAAISDSLDAARIPLNPDLKLYQSEADAGHLHITAARQTGKLIGYAFVFCKTGLHYKSTLFGHWDLYWIDPACRGHFVGVRLFNEVERAMKARGVKKMTNTRKLWHDTGPIFRRLGWHDCEILATKWIGG